MEKREGASDEKNSRRKETEEKVTRAGVWLPAIIDSIFGFFVGLKSLMQVNILNQGKLTESIKIIREV